MEMYFAPPNYMSSVKVFDIFNMNDETVGKMNLFSDNTFLHYIGRHITKRAVHNINITNQINEDNYTLKTRNLLKNSLWTADFLIFRNGNKIGKLSEVTVGNKLLIEIDNKKYKAHSPILNMYEIDFYELLDQDNESFIGNARRNMGVKNPLDTTTFVNIDTEKTSLDPLLFAGLAWLHKIVK